MEPHENRSATKDRFKRFFVYGDKNFMDSPDTKNLIDEKYVATKYHTPDDKYDYVPLEWNELHITVPGEKWLLYCMGSSSPSTEEKVDRMVAESFKMLKKDAKKLIDNKFEIWVVANPAAYQPVNTKSIMEKHINILEDNPNIHLFNWYAAILENTDNDVKNVHYSKHCYYNFQKLILYHVMQGIAGIPLLSPDIHFNTPLPYIEENFFLTPQSKSLAAKAVSKRPNFKERDFKPFYEALYYAHIEEFENPEETIRSSTAITVDETKALKFDPKTYNKGRFGKVVREHKYKKLNLEVALKVVDARGFEKDAASLFEELRKLRHPNIIVTHDVAMEAENYNILYIVTEFCDNGSFFSKICEGRPTRKNFVNWIRNVADALIYLQSEHILHCDLKPGNVIIANNNIAKICDVDSIQYVKSLDACKLPGNVQCTNRYTAPELQKREPCDSRVDVWSYSIVVLELIVAILSDDFCKDLKEGKHKSLDEILTLIPKTLQNLLRAGLKTERTERSFMDALVPLLTEVEAELGNMKDAEWQKCATGKDIEKHNNQSFLQTYRKDRDPATKVKI